MVSFCLSVVKNKRVDNAVFSTVPVTQHYEKTANLVNLFPITAVANLAQEK